MSNDFQPDILVYSDLHLHERKEFNRTDPNTGLSFRIVEGLNILVQLESLLVEYPSIDLMINLGDVFELKDRVPAHLLLAFQKCIETIGNRTLTKHVLLRGNHDFNLPGYPLPKLFSRLNFIEIPEFRTLPSGATAYFIPFQRNPIDFWNEIHKMEQLKPNLNFFHQEISGVEYENGIRVPGKPPVLDLRTVHMSGHIHKHQIVNGVIFTGSPYQIKFSDEGVDKYVWLVNSLSKELKRVKLKYPEFKSFELSKMRENRNQILEQVYECYIRIIGETEAQDWTSQEKTQIRNDLWGAGARGMIFSVQVKQHRQTRIPESRADDDEGIVCLYAKEQATRDPSLSYEKLVDIGMSIFNGGY